MKGALELIHHQYKRIREGLRHFLLVLPAGAWGSGVLHKARQLQRYGGVGRRLCGHWDYPDRRGTGDECCMSWGGSEVYRHKLAI